MSGVSVDTKYRGIRLEQSTLSSVEFSAPYDIRLFRVSNSYSGSVPSSLLTDCTGRDSKVEKVLWTRNIYGKLG